MNIEATEFPKDVMMINNFQRDLCEWIKRTKHATALEHMTKALYHIRMLDQCIEKFGTDFYKGMGEK